MFRSIHSWQKIAEYLSAHIVAPENLKNSIDPRELWRGRIQVWEQKVLNCDWYEPSLEVLNHRIIES